MIKIPGDKVAIIPIRDADKIGSIWIPDTAKERTDQGIVKYVGPDCTSGLLPGAYVTFSGYSGTLLHISDPDRPTDPGEDLIIVKEDFIFAELLDVPNTDIPGLFFRGRDGYFPANYEQSLHLIRRAIADASWRQFNPVDKTGINVVTPKPESQDYEKMRGG